MMRINIYYGGRGLIEDSTLYVMNKFTEVLNDLRVEVARYNLFEDKQGIPTLPRTLKECDGIILAVNIEWFGIGGLMQQFLDSCWLYADKEKLKKLYMMPIVISSTFGERDAQVTLQKAWELLGGIPLDGICAYVENHVEFETNPDYGLLIEKKAENLYRIINQKTACFPASTNVVKQTVFQNNSIELTPQESEQLSMYVADDSYVKKQKEDIEELTQIFKEMLGDTDVHREQEFIGELEAAFHPIEGFNASYSIELEDINRILIIEIQEGNLSCYYGQKEDADVLAKTTHETMYNITQSHMTFQRAFMSGALTAKGNFKTLRTFDTIFQFEKD